MLYVVCSMRDEVAQEFLGLNLEANEGTAIRNFEAQVTDVFNRQEGLLFTNREDFSLYRIGHYDSETGALSPETPSLLRKAGEIDVS